MSSRNFWSWRSSVVIGGSVLYLYFVLTVLTGAPVFNRYYGNFSQLVFCLLSVAFWGSGLWAYLSSDYRPTVFLLYLWNLTAALVILIGAIQGTTLFSWIVASVISLSNPTLMWQTLQAKLAETGQPVRTKVLWGWHIANAVLFVSLLIPYLLLKQPSYLIVHLPDYLLVVGNLFNIGWLVYTLRRSTNLLFRNQIRTILVGLAIPGLPIVLLTLIPRLLWGQPIVLVEFLLPLTLATPLCFLYAIRRQKLLGIDLKINRWLIIGLVFGVAGMVYLQLVFGLTYLSRKVVLNDTILLAFASIALAWLVFSPLRRRAEQWAEQLIYGSNYDYRAVVKELNDTLFSLTTTQEIGMLVCRKLADVLGARGIALVVMGSREKLIAELVAGQGNLLNLTPAQLEGLEPVAKGGQTTNWYKVGSWGTLLGQPIHHQGELYGLLLLETKASGNFYGQTDLYLLQTVASSLVIAIEKSLLLDQLREQIAELQQARQEAGLLNQQLGRVQDEEREALAYQLHDGVLQNLIFITRQSAFCQGLLELTTEAGPSLEDQLSSLSSVAEASIQEMRAMCNGLYPIAVDTIGLLAALHWLCQTTRETYAVALSLQIEGLEAGTRYPAQLERTLFLTAQEAVKNSLKHADPQSVRVRLREVGAKLMLEVWDDGRGMAETWDYGQLACEGHMGVVGMRMRAERLGGQFEITSQPGHGTCISVQLPLPLPAPVPVAATLPEPEPHLADPARPVEKRPALEYVTP